MAEIGRQVGTGHRVRSIMVQVTRHEDGSYGIATPQARGWGTLCRTQPDLALALVAAFREAEVASYSRWKGQAYDLDDTGTGHRPRRRRVAPGRSRPDVYPAEEWVALSDGRWRSPSGRSYRADSRTVQRVREKRKRLGLPY